MIAPQTERVGRYQLLEPIGSGPSGAVSRAKVFGVAGFERQFAVKRFHTELTSSPATAQALSAAARAYGSLEHPRIARMSEFGVAQGTTFTAVEYVAGVDAARLLADARASGAMLAAGGVLALISQAARAVGYAHGRGLSHLGLSPTNVLITAEGDVKITDFGILSASLPQKPTDVARLAQRVAYLSPEQLANEATSAATDVFALGALAYELVTGQRVWKGETPQQIAQSVMAGPPAEPSLPRPIVRVLHRCLARSPFERFPDARAFADALDAAIRVAPVPGTRKDIGAQVKATLDRSAAMNEGELSGVVAFNLGASQIHKDMESIAQLGRDSAIDMSTNEFVRPDTPVAGPTPLVGPARPSQPLPPVDPPGPAGLLARASGGAVPDQPATTLKDLPKLPMTTVPGLAPPPIPVPQGVAPSPSVPPAVSQVPSTLLGITNASKPPPIPPIKPPATPPPLPPQRASAPRIPQPTPPALPRVVQPTPPALPTITQPVPRISGTGIEPLPAPPSPSASQPPVPPIVIPALIDDSAPTHAIPDETQETGRHLTPRPMMAAAPGPSDAVATLETPSVATLETPSIATLETPPVVMEADEPAFDGLHDVTNALGASPVLNEPMPDRTLDGPIERPVDRPIGTSTLLGVSGPQNAINHAPLFDAPAPPPPEDFEPPPGGTHPALRAFDAYVAQSAAQPAPPMPGPASSQPGSATMDTRTQNRSRAPIIALVVIGGLAVIGVGGYFAYDWLTTDDTTPPRTNPVATGGDDARKAAPAEPDAKVAAAIEDAAVVATTEDAPVAPPPADDARVAAAEIDAGTPAPPPPGGGLTITSTPPGARVFIDGADAGVTPLKLTGSPDKHTVAILLAAHELYVAQIDGHGSFAIPLKDVTPTGGPAGIKVRCKDKDRYYVYVDGKPSGQTCPTERIETSLGHHVVEVYDITNDSRRKYEIDITDTELSYRVHVN